MNIFKKVTLLLKEIGFSDVISYGIYQAQLRSGVIKRLTPATEVRTKKQNFVSGQADLSIFTNNWNCISKSKGLLQPTAELQNILSDKFRPFFGEIAPLTLIPPLDEFGHWTEYSNEVQGTDIKKIWEPARFIWSLVLARSYTTIRDNDYAELFWKKFEEFIQSNPVNCGPNWTSAQEVALRAVTWIITVGAMLDAPATTPQRLQKLSESLYQHARRILPTLAYARSQNNNHILSESLGLVFIGECLRPYTKNASRWIEIGEKEFERSLLKQIDVDGTYSQHSTNYHRMMIQLALLYDGYLKKSGRTLIQPLRERLALASRWMIAQMDLENGWVPNLGHNDGSLIIPLGCRHFRDYRPTAQAAALAFLGSACLPSGSWDELADWLELQYTPDKTPASSITSPAVHKVQAPHMWGTLRGARFRGRPAHADQLHVDLWWNGINIARDAGTFSYNDPSPWQNALDSTRVHNTVIIDGLDQMRRISRFLWLERANAVWEMGEIPDQVRAFHNGYRQLGYRHTRNLELNPGSGFTITDQMVSRHQDNKEHYFTIHWLLPDWQWKFEDDILLLNTKGKSISLRIIASQDEKNEVIKIHDRSLIRGGVTLIGSRTDPVLGWESDTYAEKHPVLSYSCSYRAAGSFDIKSEWMLTNETI